MFNLSFFILNYIYFTEQCIVRVCSILENKHLAYTESIENSRLNYISKNHKDQSWVSPVYEEIVQLGFTKKKFL